MRTMFKTAITAMLAIVLLTTGFVSKAAAQCGGLDGYKTEVMQLQPWDGPAQLIRASFIRRVSQGAADDRIVGFWNVRFIAEGNNGMPPDGTQIDNALVQWHGDGTEIMNSSRPPATGDICMGVWQKSGSSGYQLNHFALAYNPDGSFVGPAQIKESITLDKKGNTYKGTFTIDQYDAMGNLLAHVAGNIAATRMTVDSTVGQVL